MPTDAIKCVLTLEGHLDETLYYSGYDLAKSTRLITIVIWSVAIAERRMHGAEVFDHYRS